MLCMRVDVALAGRSRRSSAATVPSGVTSATPGTAARAAACALEARTTTTSTPALSPVTWTPAVRRLRGDLVGPTRRGAHEVGRERADPRGRHADRAGRRGGACRGRRGGRGSGRHHESGDQHGCRCHAPAATRPRLATDDALPACRPAGLVVCHRQVPPCPARPCDRCAVPPVRDRLPAVSFRGRIRRSAAAIGDPASTDGGDRGRAMPERARASLARRIRFPRPASAVRSTRHPPSRAPDRAGLLTRPDGGARAGAHGPQQELGHVEDLDLLARAPSACTADTPSLSMIRQNGQRDGDRQAPVASASSMRSMLIRLPIRSSIHMRAPPAPQQKPRSRVARHLGERRTPGSAAEQLARRGVDLVVPAEVAGVVVGDRRPSTGGDRGEPALARPAGRAAGCGGRPRTSPPSCGYSLRERVEAVRAGGDDLLARRPR